MTIIKNDQLPEYSFEIPFPENLIEGDIRGIFLGIKRVAIIKEKCDVLKDFGCNIYIQRRIDSSTEITYKLIPTPFPLMEMEGMNYGKIVEINHYFDIDFLVIKNTCKMYIAGPDKNNLMTCKLSW